VVSGGEPTVLPWLPEYLAAAGGLGFQRIVLQTNGSRLASGALLESLKRVPALELLVSLPASNQSLLERLAGPHASLQAIVDGIRRAVDSGIAVEVNHVVCKPGLQDVGNIAPFLRREFAQGVQRLIYSFIAPTGRAAGAGADLVPRYSDAASPVVAALRAARDLGFLARMPEYCGIPACINPGLHEFAEPQRHSESLEVPAGKFKFAHCPTCRLNARCSGVFGRYIDLFGRAEFSNVA
jgi:hypothetical protein